jgi:hypothetical protein
MTDDAASEDLEVKKTSGPARYIRENPLAAIGGVLILGVLLARFAFLGNPEDAS